MAIDLVALHWVYLVFIVAIIGFMLFIPFLVIDLVVANILQAMGMFMLSPTIISLPFKLLLFVMVNGWVLLIKALVLGYT